jgi:uncharacterized protein
MFNREVVTALQQWAAKPERKPMVLRGARQVGKTSLVHSFAQQFKQYLYLNFELSEDRKPFENFTSLASLVQTLFIQKGLSYKQKANTLIFIDEIQELPSAMNLLRYFYEQEPKIPVIAAGSLLETIFNNKQKFPVGRVSYLVVRPASFIEFLGALKETVTLEQLHQIPLNDFAYDKLLKHFHEYAIIGGMPEAVKEYAKTKDITSLTDIFSSLLVSYLDDVEKYADSKAALNQIRHVIQTAFLEAGKRIKFEGFGAAQYKSREIGEAFRTLEKALLLNLVYPNTGTQLPILADKKKSPRLQVLDTGLVNFAAGLQADLLMSNDLSSVHKGILVEHLIGQELLATDFSALHKLQFWVRDKNTSQAEVDFIFKYKNLLVPIEVKSGATGKLKSLHLYMDMAPHKMAIRFYSRKLFLEKIITPTGTSYYLLSLPYFLACKINAYLPWFEKQVALKEATQ